MTYKIHTKAGKMQFWGTSNNPEWEGTAFHENCCPCGGCGCDLCFPQGDKLIAYLTVPGLTKEGEAATPEDIILKFFTLEGGCWVADQDNRRERNPYTNEITYIDAGYHYCVWLNTEGSYRSTTQSRICCDLSDAYCSGTKGCSQYYLEFNSPDCARGTNEIDSDTGQRIFENCVDGCTCNPISEFELNFDGIYFGGRLTIESEGVPVQWCGCSLLDGYNYPLIGAMTLTRMIHCCCSNLERITWNPETFKWVRPDPPELELTATVYQYGANCVMTAVTGISIDTQLIVDERYGVPTEYGNGTIIYDCRRWISKTPLEFKCNGSTNYLNIEMWCDAGGRYQGECCDDMRMKIYWSDGQNPCCSAQYSSQEVGIMEGTSCSCTPLQLGFGPFTLLGSCASSGTIPDFSLFWLTNHVTSSNNEGTDWWHNLSGLENAVSYTAYTYLYDGENSETVYANEFNMGTLGVVPSNAIILGVEVEIKKSVASSATSVEDSLISLTYGTVPGDSYARALIGTPATNQGYWPVSVTDVNTIQNRFVYGGPSDTWGVALTPTIVNDPTFGVAIKAHCITEEELYLSYVRIRVYWVDPSDESDTYSSPNVTGVSDEYSIYDLSPVHYMTQDNISNDVPSVFSGNSSARSLLTDYAYDSVDTVFESPTFGGLNTISACGSMGTGDMSFSFWIKKPCGACRSSVFRKETVETETGTNGVYIAVTTLTTSHLTSNINKWENDVSVGSWSQTWSTGATVNPTNEEWNHYAITFDRAASLARYYINGELSNTSDISALDGLDLSGNGDFRIAGTFYQPSFYPNNAGQLTDDFRIYDSVLSLTDIQSLAAGSEAASAPSSHWTFDVGSFDGAGGESGSCECCEEFSIYVSN